MTKMREFQRHMIYLFVSHVVLVGICPGFVYVLQLLYKWFDFHLLFSGLKGLFLHLRSKIMLSASFNVNIGAGIDLNAKKWLFGCNY